jgi:hypothetical protein
MRLYSLSDVKAKQLFSVENTDADHERLTLMSAIFFPLMSGERKIILFDLYDQILLQAYFRSLIWNVDTFYEATGYLIPIFGLKYRFLTLLTPLRAISDLI